MDLCAIPALDLARLIRSRELSAAELLTAVLARIDEANPAINAIVTLDAQPRIPGRIRVPRRIWGTPEPYAKCENTCRRLTIEVSMQLQR